MKQYVKIFKSCILAITILTSMAVIAISQDTEYKYNQITVEDGLSQNPCISIIQDRNGFMLFGTLNGLNIYDAYNFKVYTHNFNDPNSISNKYVSSLIEEESGNLWIGTNFGLNHFDRNTEKITSFFHKEEDTNSISHDYSYCMFIDSEKNFWIGTPNGLNRYNYSNKNFTRYYIDTANLINSDKNYIHKILEDKKGNLWLATRDGIHVYNKEFKKVISFQNNPSDINCPGDNIITDLCFDKDQNIWISNMKGIEKMTYDSIQNNYLFTKYYYKEFDERNYARRIFMDSKNNLWVGAVFSLYQFDPDKETFTNFPETIDIFSIYEDTVGSIWVGTWNNGVFTYYPNIKKFKHYTKEKDNKNSLSNNNVWSVFEDNEGLLWVGTSKGLNRFDRKSNTFTLDLGKGHTPNTVKGNWTWDMCEDHENNIWFACLKGVFHYNKETKYFTHYKNDPNNELSLNYDGTNSVLIDHTGELWIATNRGLDKFNKENKKFTHHVNKPDDSTSIAHTRVLCVIEDKQHDIWVATFNGISKFTKQTRSFRNFNLHTKYSEIDFLNIYCLLNDFQDRLWIGTESGLLEFNKESNQFISHKLNELNDIIYAILEDDEGVLWLSTGNGIIKYNPDNHNTRNYFVSDGIQSNEFNMFAYNKSKNGELFFGGVNGFNAFYPHEIKDNPNIPPVVIIDLKILNKSVKPGIKMNNRIILNQSIQETKEITLTHKDKFFSFDFTALNYINSEKNQYAYMLEGFDKEWNYIGTRRFASFSNLPQGTYIFKVKGSNNDGLWNEEGTSIRIIVLPPFWKTWWFIALTITIVIGSISFWYWNRLNQIKKQNLILEQKVKERTAEVVAQKNEIEKQAKELAKLSIVASETENAIAILDPDGNFEWVNEGFICLHGFSLKEYVELKGINLINSSTNPEIKDLVEQCILKKIPVIYQSYNISKSNEKIWTQTTLTPILDENGELLNLVTIEADIRRIKEYESDILLKNEEIASQRDSLAEVNATKDKFFSIISHDLKSPFNALLGFSEIITTSFNTLSRDKIGIFGSQIYSSAKSLFSLVENLLAWSRSKSGKIKMQPENLDLLNLIEETVDIIRISSENKQINIDISDVENIQVFADNNLISTSIRNLLSNAIKFSEENSKVTISANLKNKFIEVSISDSGVGIKEDNLAKLFREDTHFTTRGTQNEKGTGLGLILCKEFIELNGGEIWVKSEVGKGTIFTFTIPLAK